MPEINEITGEVTTPQEPTFPKIALTLGDLFKGQKPAKVTGHEIGKLIGGLTGNVVRQGAEAVSGLARGFVDELKKTKL